MCWCAAIEIRSADPPPNRVQHLRSSLLGSARRTKSSVVRRDARCAVQRIPGEAAVWALRDGFEFASEDVKYAFAESLRDRGVKVTGYPSKKLEPTRQTKVKPVEE